MNGLVARVPSAVNPVKGTGTDERAHSSGPRNSLGESRRFFDSTRKGGSGWRCGVVARSRGTQPTGRSWPRCACPSIDRRRRGSLWGTETRIRTVSRRSVPSVDALHTLLAVRLLVLSHADDGVKDLEILVLRHQLRVLRRKSGRPRFTARDRILLAAASRVLPRQRRHRRFSSHPRRCCAGTAR